jgi:hypothetical protein
VGCGYSCLPKFRWRTLPSLVRSNTAPAPRAPRPAPSAIAVCALPNTVLSGRVAAAGSPRWSATGRLRLLGCDPGGYGPRREIRRRLGYLPQNLGYYPAFTVVEFVEYFALLKEMPPTRIPAA